MGSRSNHWSKRWIRYLGSDIARYGHERSAGGVASLADLAEYPRAALTLDPGPEYTLSHQVERYCRWIH